MFERKPFLSVAPVYHNNASPGQHRWFKTCPSHIVAVVYSNVSPGQHALFNIGLHTVYLMSTRCMAPALAA
jgi:hypothetical protein